MDPEYIPVKLQDSNSVQYKNSNEIAIVVLGITFHYYE